MEADRQRTRPDVESVGATADTVTVRFGDGLSAAFNRFWLRDNCPADGDRASLARSCSVADLPDDLAIVSATAVAAGLRIVFNDGTDDVFDVATLERYASDPAATPTCTQSWAAGLTPRRFAIASLGSASEHHRDLLEAVARDGFALVDGLGADDTDRLAGLLGPIRETDFGRIFDIVTEPDPFTPSQSEAALDPHTDDPYRYSPAGVSILHCVSPSGHGGASTIVDGFGVAERLAAVDPAAYDLLAVTPVPYVHRRSEAVGQGADVHLRAEAPVISVDRAGRPCGIRFHERSMAPLSLPAHEAEQMYRALMRFARLVLGDEFAYHHRLPAGEAIVYDNQRVLHGRAAIDGATGRRHLRLCTIDRDQVHSRLRRLRELHRTGTESDLLPAGTR